MQYQGDIAPGQSLYLNFTSFSSSGTMSSLSGSANALAVYKDNNTAFSTSGVSLTKDFNSRVGLNNVKVDTSTDSIFYAAGHDFSIVIISGTVLGQSWAGEVVGEFSINNRANLRPLVNGQNGVNVSVTGSVSLTSPQVVNIIGNITGTLTGNIIGTIGNVTGSVAANVIQISGSPVNAALPQLGVNLLQVDGVNNATHASGNVPADIRNISGSTSGIITANVTQIDGANNVSHVAGAIPADLRGIRASVINQTFSSNLANSFTKFFDVSGSVSTVDHLNLVDNVTNPVTAGNVTGSVLGNVNGSVGSLLNQGVVTVSGSLSSPQNFNLIGNISGTSVGNRVGNIQGSVANVTGSVGGVIGLTPSNLDVLVSSRQPSGTVVVSANNDKTGYGLSSPQSVNIIGNISGTLTNVINVLNQGVVTVSGTVTVGANNDKTGYGLATPQNFNLIGNISGTVSEVLVVDKTINLVSGTSSGLDAAGVRSAVGLASANLDTQLSGISANTDVKTSSRMPSGTVVVGTNNDKSGYGLSNPQAFNLIGNISGTVSEVKLVDVTVNLVSGTSGGAGSDPWLTALPGAYGPGTAGSIVGNDLDAKISSRQPSGTGGAPTVQQIDTQLSASHGAGNWGFQGTVNIDASSVWNYAIRTLTTPAGIPVPPVPGSEIFVVRGDTFVLNIVAIDLTNIVHMQFTVKMKLTDDDTESLLYVDSNGGLVYVNGGPASIPSNGSINYIAASGTATIRVEAAEMAKLGLVTDAKYDIQIIRSTGTIVNTPMQGDFNILGDSTRATS
jgi:hypothetical protein